MDVRKAIIFKQIGAKIAYYCTFSTKNIAKILFCVYNQDDSIKTMHIIFQYEEVRLCF